MTSKTQSLISVCVGSIRPNTLPFLVESIIDQQFSNWELVVAVQGDDQSLINYIVRQAQLDSRISYIHLNRFGRSCALNQAAIKAQSDIIAFTDDDCVASKDWLSTIYHCFQVNANVGIIAGDCLPSPIRSFNISTCPATRTIEHIYRPCQKNGFSAPPGFYWGGANFAARRSILDIVGPFDEYLGPGTEFPAAEDVDFALRAEALGVVIWTTPRSIIYHTYGRRYGIKDCLKYHRLSAIGSGALLGKLCLWDHRLTKEWGKRKKPNEWVAGIMKNPIRALVDLYKSKYSELGYRTFLSQYGIDANILSYPLGSKKQGM